MKSFLLLQFQKNKPWGVLTILHAYTMLSKWTPWFSLDLKTVIIYKAYLTVVIVRQTMTTLYSKHMSHLPQWLMCHSVYISPYQQLGMWWCYNANVLEQESPRTQGVHLKLLLLQQLVLIIDIWVSMSGLGKPGHTLLAIVKHRLQLKAKCSCLDQDVPPLILICWDITARRRIKPWLMAKAKSLQPVTTCQFKSMWWGLPVLKHGWRQNPFKDLIGRGLASGKMGYMGVP